MGLWCTNYALGGFLATVLAARAAEFWGWRWAFLITGSLGFAWLVLWWWLYRKPEQHPRLSSTELANVSSGGGMVPTYILSDKLY